MKQIQNISTTWKKACCVALLLLGIPGTGVTQEWFGQSAASQEQPVPFQGQGTQYANPQAEPGRWDRRILNNTMRNRSSLGTGSDQTVAGTRQGSPQWTGAVQGPPQDSRQGADASWYAQGATTGSVPTSPAPFTPGNSDWSPLTDTGLLGIGVVGNGPDGLRRYLEDLKKWLAVNDTQTEAWDAFTKAATGFVTSRINPLTTIPDIHLNSVDWAKKRTEAFKEWLQLREAVVTAYEKLHAVLDADQKEHADRLSGFFRQGGGS
ncbi:MAG: hypothetical protein H7833_05450 [Magnetococcus sp. DMHC-1]|nr:hypothetical protein [Magnetococcales bacterium]